MNQAEQRRQIWERDGGICGICSEAADPKRWELDHIIQKSLGGSNDLDNLRVAHPECNRNRPKPRAKQIAAPATGSDDIWAIRTWLGMSRAEFARRIQVAEHTVTLWEYGRKPHHLKVKGIWAKIERGDFAPAPTD